VTATGGVWRDLDRVQLDRQLNLREKWPEHVDIIARWERDSRAVRDAYPHHRNLSYGASPLETFDVFMPEIDRPPLFVFIHGGYWQTLDKDAFTYLVPAFLKAGIGFANLNYELAPAVSLGRICEEIAAATDRLFAEADELRFDSERVVLAGHSAGGHLAVAEIVRERLANPADPSRYRAVVSVSGIYDLAPIGRSYQQAVLSLSRDEIARLSPLRRAPADAPRLLLAVGAEETPEFLRQQAALETHWQALDLPVEATTLPQRNHFDVVDALAEPDHPLQGRVFDLCREATTETIRL